MHVLLRSSAIGVWFSLVVACGNGPAGPATEGAGSKSGNLAAGSGNGTSGSSGGGIANGGNATHGGGTANMGGASGGADAAGNGNGSGGMLGDAGSAGQAMAGSAGDSGSGGALQSGMGPFPSSAPFYADISKAKLDSESATIMKALDDIGWGDPDKRTTLGIDFSFNINVAEANVAKRSFTKSAEFYEPDCDTAPVPLPAGGKGEGVDDYACGPGEDCHLFVYQGNRYYELYQSNITGGQAVGGTFTATCLVVWDLTKDYWVSAAPPNFSRGDGCTGADAANLPMAPLVLTKADLESGNIKHALRFTILNNRIRAGVYVHPATHLGGPTGGNDMLPYGARLRLRADYDLASLPNDHARTVAKALQTYGMYLADGGNIYISATSDAVGLIKNSILTALEPSDFEMVDGGPRIQMSQQDCPHVPLTQ